MLHLQSKCHYLPCSLAKLKAPNCDKASVQAGSYCWISTGDYQKLSGWPKACWCCRCSQGQTSKFGTLSWQNGKTRSTSSIDNFTLSKIVVQTHESFCMTYAQVCQVWTIRAVKTHATEPCLFSFPFACISSKLAQARTGESNLSWYQLVNETSSRNWSCALSLMYPQLYCMLSCSELKPSRIDSADFCIMVNSIGFGWISYEHHSRRYTRES